MLNSIKQKLQKEAVFAISCGLAVLTSIFTLPTWRVVDWRVIILLFNLMAVLLAFEKLKILDKFAISLLARFRNKQQISLILVSLTFASSMLITNDVALITFVPLTIIIAKRASFDPGYIIILQTIAANIGSSLTPMGNPQNLFLFSFYHLSAQQFFIEMLPLAILGTLWLLILNLKTSNHELKFKLDSVQTGNTAKIYLYILLFIFIVLAVFRIVDYRISFCITALIITLFDRDLIKRIDYFLLATFICFFIFVHNIASLPAIAGNIEDLFNTKTNSYLSAIILSQAISNVPCSILVANFTEQWKAVLLGVNIGGMGTLIASLASLISYKFYASTYDGKTYLLKFHYYNFVSLFIFAAAIYFLL